MNTAETFLADIPLGMAVQAFQGTSFTPEKRGASYRQDYADTMAADFEQMRKNAEKGGTLDQLEAEFERYRAGYCGRYRAFLNSQSRCVSSMIAGPSNFPVRRMQKRNAVVDNRMKDLIDFRERGLKAAIRNLRPDLRPIMSGDADAIQRLTAELEQLEAKQARMKFINNAFAKFKKDPEILDVLDLSDAERKMIREYVPRYSWEPRPFAPYELTNNGASIRRVKERIEQLSRAKATPDTKIEGEGVRLEDCPAENRIRLFFDGKPDADIRAKLKSNGFRWAPTLGAWQAYRNPNSMRVAQSMVGAAA